MRNDNALNLALEEMARKRRADEARKLTEQGKPTMINVNTNSPTPTVRETAKLVGSGIVVMGSAYWAGFHTMGWLLHLVVPA